MSCLVPCFTSGKVLTNSHQICRCSLRFESFIMFINLKCNFMTCVVTGVCRSFDLVEMLTCIQDITPTKSNS